MKRRRSENGDENADTPGTDSVALQMRPAGPVATPAGTDTATLATILLALENIQATVSKLDKKVTAIQDTQLSLISTQQHLSNHILQLQNRNKKFYTRLQDLPLELIADIFAWIPVQKVLKYRRLSRKINKCLLTHQVAVLKLQIPHFQKKYKQKIGGLWFFLPHQYQTVIARAIASHLKSVDGGGRKFGHIKKTFPTSISYFTAAEELLFNSSMFKGAIPDSFGGLNNLANIDLSENSLTGGLPPSLGLLTGLRRLNLSDNRLSGEFPALPNLNALEEVDIAGNHFTGPLPTVFGNSHKLKILHADHNIFSRIPDSISELTSLLLLYINGNPISSEIPPEIWTLRSLKVLGMSGCNMFGSLAGVGALQNLKYLNVCNNKLSGKLPYREIESLHSLVQLHLSRNQFSGSDDEKLYILELPNLTSMCADRSFHRNYVHGSYSESELELESGLVESESESESE
ncbi:hypothetical protein HDU77_010517 [Chytriomyces hyalinus]|nr:hypothetical protein HDU77_010517 [Chytriomyces hyalinus]